MAARLGIALGSGAARGWAHIGVLRALEEAGSPPSIVCGSSIGAVVGAFYAAGELDALERWVRDLEWRQLVGYFDLSLRGGLFKARRVFEALAEHLPDRALETLALPFAAVATDLSTGEEVWLREGSTLDAVRASVALPGLVTPVRIEGRWLVDGGLTNPVPVSLCRAMGADTVIAVNLNTQLLGRRAHPRGGNLVVPEESGESRVPAEEATEAVEDPTPLRSAVQDWAAELRQRFVGDEAEPRDESPSIYEVMANSVNIMQVGITRSRLAGYPPDLLIAPRLAQLALLDFDRGAEAIEEGRRAVALALSVGAHVIGGEG